MKISPWVTSSTGESAELERVQKEYENHVAIDTLKRELRRGGAYRSEPRVELTSDHVSDIEVNVHQSPSTYLDLSKLSITGLNTAINYATQKQCKSDEVFVILSAPRIVRALRSARSPTIGWAYALRLIVSTSYKASTA